MLEAYPNRTIIRTFDVAESGAGHDRAALIDKFGGKSADKSGAAGGPPYRPDASRNPWHSRAHN